MKKLHGFAQTALLVLWCAMAPFGAAQDQADAGERPAEDRTAETGDSTGDPFDASMSGEGDEEGLDPFDTSAFDQTIEEGVDAGEGSRISSLVGGSVALKSLAVVTEGFDGLYGSTSAAAKVFAKVEVPDYGALYAAWNIRHTFFLGSTGEAAAAPDFDPFTPVFSLSELHYSFDIGKAVFLRLGNQLISWGPSRIWTPVDFINLERPDPFGAVDIRTGKPGLRLHVPFTASNIFVFADFSGAAGAEADPAGSISLGGRIDATLGDFELGLSGYGGGSVREKAGFDFSGRLPGTTVYGEAAWAPAAADKENIFQGSLGFSRPFGDLKRWSVSGEFFYNSTGDDYTDRLPPAGTVPLYSGKTYGYTTLSATDLIPGNLDGTLSGLVNFSDLSWTAKLSGTFTLGGVPPFTAAFSLNGGGEGKEFTRYPGNNSLEISLSSRIEF